MQESVYLKQQLAAWIKINNLDELKQTQIRT